MRREMLVFLAELGEMRKKGILGEFLAQIHFR